jgi:hypothetical protein
MLLKTDIRVTRLCEYSPFGRYFTLGNLKKYTSNQFVCIVYRDKKLRSWARFWAIFFTKHLVTLNATFPALQIFSQVFIALAPSGGWGRKESIKSLFTMAIKVHLSTAATLDLPSWQAGS